MPAKCHLVKLLFCLLSFGATPLSAGEATVFAAASLGGALDEVAAIYERETGDRITLSLAGSSVLARQIDQGAPADIFISANSAWMDHLEGQGRILPESRADLLGNRLVLVTQAGAAGPTDPAAIAGQGRLAMALTEAVPAGIYGRAALQSLGLWDAVAPAVVETDNVRAALALVAIGAARYGIVYATDAAAEPRVAVAHVFAPGTYPPIRYPAALVAPGGNETAGAFLDFLRGAAARGLFARAGFSFPDPGG